MRPRMALNKKFTTFCLLILVLGGIGGFVGAQKIAGDYAGSPQDRANTISVSTGIYAVPVGDPAIGQWVRLSLDVQQSSDNFSSRAKLRDMLWTLCMQAADMPMVSQSANPDAALLDAIRTMQPVLAPSIALILITARTDTPPKSKDAQG